MKIDLHCHSTASDGALTPAQLVARASQQRIGLLALTDHDTVAGLPAARESAAAEGVRLIAGIELSTRWSSRNLHIVGLDIDPQSPALARLIELQGVARDTRARAIADKLAKLGFAGAYDGAQQEAGDSIIGRPHFARWLVATGKVESESEAFHRYLGNGKPCDISLHWPEMPLVVEAILAAGGVPVLAHPGKYDFTWSKLRILLQAFGEAGGLAMEVSYGGEQPDRCRYLNELAARYNLEGSVGSDFHSPRYTWTELGRYPVLKAIHQPVWQRWLGD